MRSRQRGATFLGMVVIVAILGLALYAGIRLAPMYLEYMAVAARWSRPPRRHADAGHAAACCATSLERRWTIEDIDSISPKDIEIKKAGSGFTMRAWYRAEAPFVGNVSLVADFDKTVDGQAGDAAAGGCSAALKTAREWLRDALGYECRDPALLEAALTHRSAGGAAQRTARIPRRRGAQLRRRRCWCSASSPPPTKASCRASARAW